MHLGALGVNARVPNHGLCGMFLNLVGPLIRLVYSD
jgi:hypothetical protein